MPNIINPNFNYTFDGNLLTELLLKPSVENPDLFNVFRVETGIAYKAQFHLLQPLGKMLQGVQGCGPQSTTGQSVQVTNRTLQTAPMGFYLEQCYDTFESTVLGEALRAGVRRSDLNGTTIGNAIARIVREAGLREAFRIGSFGDTTSPAGDPAYYGMMDGLWPTLIGAASSYAVTLVDNITALSQTTGQRALDYLRNIVDGASITLKQRMSGKVIMVTGNVYENLMITYEDKAADGGGLLVRIENGQQRLFFRGIEVRPVYAWDYWIEADNLGNNTRILYTVADNHVLGFNEASSFGELDVWYDRDTKYMKYRGEFNLGYQYLHDELTAISYGNV